MTGQQNRSPHAGDRELFGSQQLPALQAAARQLSWLLTRGYSEKAALKLVGDRHALVQRQRRAVQCCSCTDAAAAARAQRRLATGDVAGRQLALDGFNAIILIESALDGGPLLRGRDGCYRDLASVHGSYLQVHSTERALLLLGQELAARKPAQVCWYLDRPVSHSGELGQQLLRLARQQGWSWQVELCNDPDRALAAAAEVVVISSDAWVLDSCRAWCDLVGRTIRRRIPQAWTVEFF